MGAAMVYTEFVSAEAAVRDISSTVRKLHIDERGASWQFRYMAVSLEAMVEAARIVERAQPDIIDINFGCPIQKRRLKGAEPECCATYPNCSA